MIELCTYEERGLGPYLRRMRLAEPAPSARREERSRSGHRIANSPAAGSGGGGGGGGFPGGKTEGGAEGHCAADRWVPHDEREPMVVLCFGPCSMVALE